MTMKQDIRIERTLTKIHDAFLSLLETYPVHEITVKMLTHTATINRTTFYTHYENMGDFTTQFISNHVQILYNFMKPLNYKTFEHGFELEVLIKLFEHIQNHSAMYQLFFTSNHLPQFQYEVRSFLQHKISNHTSELSRFHFPGVEVEPNIVSWYGTSALIGTITMWLAEDLPYSPHYLSTQFSKLAPNPSKSEKND